MENKQVVLIRKQPTEFVANYPYGENGNVKSYIWKGTTGKVLNERPVPYDVFEWLNDHTTTFTSGALIIKETDDEDVVLTKENIENIETIEQSILTKDEIVDMLQKGNQNVLKKALKELSDKTSEEMEYTQKRYIIGIASDLGIDSSAKRKVLVDWAKLDYDNSDIMFDKVLDEMYQSEAK